MVFFYGEQTSENEPGVGDHFVSVFNPFSSQCSSITTHWLASRAWAGLRTHSQCLIWYRYAVKSTRSYLVVFPVLTKWKASSHRTLCNPMEHHHPLLGGSVSPPNSGLERGAKCYHLINTFLKHYELPTIALPKKPCPGIPEELQVRRVASHSFDALHREGLWQGTETLGFGRQRTKGTMKTEVWV